MSDYYNIIDSAEKRAREEGLLQGRLEGLTEAARKMLASGIALEVVADILQLPVEQLKDRC